MTRLVALACLVATVTSSASAASALHVRVLRLVDSSRAAHYRNGTTAPRVLVTTVRYPAGRGPFPLIVFAHGFALTPQSYALLLDAWARAGYVVAAPAFPVERATAPGGPDESDLVNEPRDIAFVIAQLMARLRGLIDASRIAVAGHSDGAEAALSAAYDARFRDPRIRAAVIMSGGALPGFAPPRRGAPPLLAIQGTGDTINAPGTTSAYYALMRRPKFLLWLLGAPHRPPYTTRDRWFPTVIRTTTAFLDHYLRGAPLAPLLTAGTRPGVARLAWSP